MERVSKKIYEWIEAHDDFIIVPHQNPDGDALGSATALADFLHERNKKFTIFCATGTPKNMAFLAYNRSVTSNPAVWDNPDVGGVIFVDSGDPVYAGVAHYLERTNLKPYIINIDHHATNQQYGNLNLVIPTASSTTEILYQFFVSNNADITPNMATSLLTGLITDTGNFSNAGTSRHALKIAGDLIKKGAQLNRIRLSVLKNKTITTLKFWGIVLSRLTIHESTHIAYTYFTQEDVRACAVTEEEGEGIANLLNYLSEGKASLVAREKNTGEIKVSMRTTQDGVDVSQIAQRFGGGGHKKAAGFTVEGPMEKALEHIFKTII